MPTKLDAYQAKRDFQKTAEPAGDDVVRPSKALRFVVQRHDANRLHYDLRLELDGVFKSWAVTKGPSLNPADKRLAVETEDHPLGYGDFEGTIPKGQYGGGTVQLFDRGTWAPERDTTRAATKRGAAKGDSAKGDAAKGDSPAAALAAGELKFVLKGKRLKGSFVLVRMKGDKFGGKRTNWLLIKHRDAHADDTADGGGVPAIETSVASGRRLEAIAAGTGRRPTPFMLPKGKAPANDAIWDSSKVSAKAAREANPAPPRPSRPPTTRTPDATDRVAMPDFVPPQFCRSIAKPPSGAKWLHEIKFDGYRLQVRVEDGAARLRTRTGLDWTDKFPAVATAAARLPDAILDGEIVALDATGNPSFPALQAAIAAERTDALAYFAFDLLFHAGRDLRRLPLASRKAQLADLLAAKAGAKPIGQTIRYVEHFDADGPSVYKSAQDLGLEGIVSKQTKAIYRSGKSDSWTKSKCRAAHEVVLGGWTETKGKFRSLVGGVFRDGKLAYVGRIGTGYSASTIERLLPKLKAHAAATSPFDKKSAPPRNMVIRWLDPVLVAEIEFAGWSADDAVRQAAFKGLREDKPAREVVAEKPVKAKEPDMSPATTDGKPSDETPVGRPTKASGAKPSAKVATSGKSGKVSVRGVAISNPDKALWPDAGDGAPVTKLDLADYFAAVGGWMLPHIQGRLCSIIRAPDGIGGQTFFQRHAMAGASELIEPIHVRGDREAYLAVNSIAALAAVAQSGGLELHPSNAVPGEPEVPGRLVFDLDPAPDVTFADVVAAAKALKTQLEDLGLVPFCKTTGGKGLHVVTPLTPDAAIDWDGAKQFAHDVVLAMERDAPKLYLTKASKSARKGKIYLDYLRNDHIATAVAPLSPRGRPHAPVSMPLTWAQVKADLDPARFTVRTVPQLIARSKAWEDYAKAARSIAAAIGRLGRR